MKNKFILIFFVIFLLCNIHFYIFNHYDKRKYQIKVDHQEITYYIQEKYTLTSFPFFVHTKTKVNEMRYNEKVEALNEVKLKKPQLHFEAYQCYNVHNEKKLLVPINIDLVINRKKKISLTPSKLVIQYKHKILYEGKYIEDLSPYLKEEGRYYFTLFLKKSDHLWEKTESMISFEIKFVGVDYE